MCSSRLDSDTGIVTVTTSAAWCEVGHELYTLAAAATFNIDHADWCLRLLRPRPLTGNASNVGPDTAEAELALAVRLGVVYETPIEEPRAA